MQDWVLSLIEQGGYWGIAFLMVLENIVPPVPSEVIMGLAGMAIARGTLEYWPVMIVATVGTTFGNLFWFEIGRRLGYQRLRPWIERWGRWLTVDWSHVEAAIRFFRSHGQWVIFASRFSPVMRTMLSLPAGLAHMSRVKFLAFTFAGAAIWNAVLIEGGRLLARFSETAREVTAWVLAITALMVVAIYLWRIATWNRRH